MRSDKEIKKRIRIPMRGTGDTCNLTIDGLSRDEFDQVISAIESGLGYISVIDGKLIFYPRFKDLPELIEDEEMYPFWRNWSTHNQSIQKPLFENYQYAKEIGYSPSISISSLCGYYYTKENYKVYAERLESYGFECMRSKRREDGKFWEKWYLPCLSFSKGDLKQAIGIHSSDEQRLSGAFEFLRSKIQFGSLDVSTQRMAMAIPG